MINIYIQQIDIQMDEREFKRRSVPNGKAVNLEETQVL